MVLGCRNYFYTCSECSVGWGAPCTPFTYAPAYIIWKAPFFETRELRVKLHWRDRIYTYLHKKVLWASTSLSQVWVLQSDLLWLSTYICSLSHRFWSEEMGKYTTLSLITIHKILLVLWRHKMLKMYISHFCLLKFWSSLRSKKVKNTKKQSSWA